MSNRDKSPTGLPERPLSPHISIYKPQITSVLSILHRITGVINFFTLLAIAWWIFYIVYISGGPSECDVCAFLSTDFGHVVLMLWSYSLFFHFFTGIRHLVWDMGHWFSLRAVSISGWGAVFLATASWALSWYFLLA